MRSYYKFELETLVETNETVTLMSLILAAEVPSPHIFDNEMLFSAGTQMTQQGIVESTPLNTLYIIF